MRLTAATNPSMYMQLIGPFRDEPKACISPPTLLLLLLPDSFCTSSSRHLAYMKVAWAVYQSRAGWLAKWHKVGCVSTDRSAGKG